MNGSKIFVGGNEDGSTESGVSGGNFNNRTSVRIAQQAAIGISQISFSTEEKISPTDIFGPPSEAPARSSAWAIGIKENKDMGEPAPRALRTSAKVSDVSVPSCRRSEQHILFGDEPVVKTSKKIYDQKFAELTGNNIFKGDVPLGSAEKPLSVAKLKEMSGNGIFSDGKAESRDYFNHLMVRAASL
ncbi:hematological/neurological-like protein [Salvia divinorum]|uniref:Hematological/neurological-like protein n=1 Tax=Salvia divinorum TaxID=28513 RepID=A0ABD1FZ05_SALDI